VAANGSDRLAVLIDADNAQSSSAQALLAEIARYGTATVRRAYGNWTTQNLVPWKDVLHSLAITPVQQFSYTKGKNATDSALIIDAMDLLHGGAVDGFCLVSSDSDFTRLATRIREAGMRVYGFGERKTPEPFVKACDKFTYVEILTAAPAAEPRPTDRLSELNPRLIAAVNDAAQEDGWAQLGAVGSLLSKADPSFDVRTYGFKKLSDLVRKHPMVQVKAVEIKGAPPSLYVRVKEK